MQPNGTTQQKEAISHLCSDVAQQKTQLDGEAFTSRNLWCKQHRWGQGKKGEVMNIPKWTNPSGLTRDTGRRKGVGGGGTVLQHLETYLGQRISIYKHYCLFSSAGHIPSSYQAHKGLQVFPISLPKSWIQNHHTQQTAPDKTKTTPIHL